MATIRPIVLIVEDEVDIATALARIVESRGFDSRIAYTAKQAIDAINPDSDRVCLVILDILLPKGSGIEVAKKILEEHPHIRIVISTGVSDYTCYKELMTLGIKAFLHKPYEIDALDRVLRGDA